MLVVMLSAYETHSVLGPRFRNDMLHIAVATVGEVDVVVSWNFKHIVRLDKIQLFNGINIELGYRPLAIEFFRQAGAADREKAHPLARAPQVANLRLQSDGLHPSASGQR